MSRRRTTRIGALAASTALLLSGCDFSVYDLPLPGGADVGDDPYRVTVMFRDVLDLVPQSAVKVDDVSVGRVEEIEVQDYHAKVTLLLHDDVELPGNAVAEIRQTSLLGEKFVSLSPPPRNPSSEELGDGDVIGLERSGRNPEVEEVLGALSLVLNGGGVAQLKTITTELNKTFKGREGTVKSVMRRTSELMGQLDGSKEEIVEALERVNSLSVSLNEHTDDLDLALEELPSAIASVDRQRDDLVRMLRALTRLSGIGTRVIQASKAGTIDSLESLAPTLTKLAESGDSLAKSLQIVLTYPFVDSVVGTNPQQARDLHMGDYMNLSFTLDLELGQLLETAGAGDLRDLLGATQLDRVLEQVFGIAGGLTGLLGLGGGTLPGGPGGGQGGNGGNGGGGGGLLGDLGGLLGGGGQGGGQGGGRNGGQSGQGSQGGSGGLLGGLLGRAAVGEQPARGAAAPAVRPGAVDSDLAAMLVWGMTS
ncbi:MCE family protein [Nocardioides caldifontis]|uniref:MCE family protein n=1 Tax=Nocardioides caldifontis TaxID=2588938 RepID=UPI0011DF1B74|nr:MCE family protein [Nocardioides caldifontis]